MAKRILECAEDYRIEAIDALGAFDQRVHAQETVRQWGVPTPCDGWTTGDLIVHVTGSVRMFIAVTGCQPGDQQQVPGNDQPSPPGVIEDWERTRSIADAYLRTCGEPQAIRVPFGEREMTIAFAIEALVRDVVIHTWDLAHATGGDEVLPARLITAATASLSRLPQRIRERGLYADSVSSTGDATDQDRLLALAGRHP